LRRGTLQGHKVDGEWKVIIPAPTVGQQDATEHQQDATVDRRDATEHRQDEPTERDRTPTVDLAPLVSHIATLEDQVQRLTAASTLWQERARTLEQRLLAIEAGTTPDTSPEAPQSPVRDGTGQSGVLWIRRLWRG